MKLSKILSKLDKVTATKVKKIIKADSFDKRKWILFAKETLKDDGVPSTDLNLNAFGDLMQMVYKRFGKMENMLWDSVNPEGTEDRMWVRAWAMNQDVKKYKNLLSSPDSKQVKLILKQFDAVTKDEEISGVDLDKMVNAYLAAALWSSLGDDDEPFDKKYDRDDIAARSINKAKKDCAEFLKQAKKEWFEDLDMEKIGHLFWLNRNGHGSGFWDESNISKEHGKLLSDLSHKFGGIDPYVGDDGKIYIDM